MFTMEELNELVSAIFKLIEKKADVTFTIPAALNGQITPGETDIYKFTAEKGKKITFQFFGRYFNRLVIR